MWNERSYLNKTYETAFRQTIFYLTMGAPAVFLWFCSVATSPEVSSSRDCTVFPEIALWKPNRETCCGTASTPAISRLMMPWKKRSHTHQRRDHQLPNDHSGAVYSKETRSETCCTSRQRNPKRTAHRSLSLRNKPYTMCRCSRVPCR